jgi:esterase/lipase
VTRSVWSWSALFAGVLLLAAGVLGGVYAADGVRSVSVRVAGVPVEVVRPVGDGVGRPAVVVAHGYAGSGRLMRPFADTLARRGYVVALPDLAGHAGNTRPLADQDVIDRELAGAVRYVRGLPEVDAARVALLGHSMGAAAVVRVGAADPSIAATVAISLGDDAAAALRPGPRRLLSIVGALEPAGLQAVARSAGAGAGRREVRVPLVEHVGVLYADRTHHEAARWLDEALDHRPEQRVIAAKRRVVAGGLSMVGMLLLVVAALVRPSRRGARTLSAAGLVGPPRIPLAWLAGAAAVASVSGLLGGWLLAWTLPSALCGYLVGYFTFAGAILGAAALVARRRPETKVDGPALLRTVALAVAAGVAVVAPVHLGLTSAVPHGPRWWLVALLAFATAALLCAAHAVAGPSWSVVVLAAVCLPLPVAAVVGLAPGFLAIVTPLIGALLGLHLLLTGVARLAGMPWWRTIPAGAVLVAWPVATALPLT